MKMAFMRASEDSNLSLRGVRDEQSHTMMRKQYYIYIITNKWNSVLYTGVTNDLARGVYEHRDKLVDGFTNRYNVSKLVYYELSEDVGSAIAREKQMKAGSPAKKTALIQSMNPEWNDLYEVL